jgi:hypothetical protein
VGEEALVEVLEDLVAVVLVVVEQVEVGKQGNCYMV